MTLLVLVLSLVAVAAGARIALSGHRSRLDGALCALFGLAGLIFLGVSYVQEVGLPELPALPTIEISLIAVTAVLAFTFLLAGAIKQWPRVTALGLAFLIGFLYLVFAPSMWFLWIGLIASALFFVSETEGVYNKINLHNLVIAVAMPLLMVAGFIGVYTSPVIDGVKQMYEAIKVQLASNNEKFSSYSQMCLDAEPGSTTATICIELNSVRNQVNSNTADIAALTAKVDANTTAIQTLTGEVATVTEKPADENANQQIIQSNPSDDEAAAAALAKELVAAGWKAGEFSVNDIDRSIRTDQGNYPFGDRIDGIKSRLVEVLNGSEPWQAAIRDRVLSAVPESEHARLLSGDGYYAIQFKRPVCLGGSDYYKDGTAFAGDGGKVCYEAGDVSWAFVGSDGTVYWGASVRDACNNPHYDTAPTPQGVEQAELCPEGTDRAGQMVGSGCDYPEEQPPGEQTPPGSTPPGSTPPGSTPPGSTPPGSTPPSTPPSSTPPSTPPTTVTTTTYDDSKPDASPRDPNRDPLPSPSGAPETTPVVNSDPAQPGTTAATTIQAPGADPRPSPTPGQDPAPSVDSSPSVDNTGDAEPTN